MTLDEAKETKIGQFFTLHEFIDSDTAQRKGLMKNQLAISKDAIDNAKLLCSEILDKVRNQFGPVHISSGYRSAELNEAIGGSTTSQHCKGEAADIQLPNLELVFRYIKNHLWCDQVIFERKGTEGNGYVYWIHVSKKRIGHNRGDAFYMTNNKKSPKFEVK